MMTPSDGARDRSRGAGGRPFVPSPPTAGLYEAGFERDACGIALLADLTGAPSHRLVRRAVLALEHLAHRGASGSEQDSGDGAGILIQLPHAFLAAVVDFELPAPGHYAAGLAFLPADQSLAAALKRQVATIAAAEGVAILGWRDVPIDPSALGTGARAEMPRMAQLFVAPVGGTEPTAFSKSGAPGCDLRR